MQELLAPFIQEGLTYGWLESIAVLSALVYVYLASKGNRLCFIFGLISSAIYVYLTIQLKLYFDTFINSYYIYMSFAGWFAWKKQNNGEIAVQKLTTKKLNLSLLIGFPLTFLLAFWADQYTDASIPYLDAFTTVFSIIATWMVVKKYLENWLFWIVIDAVAAGMYFYKELYLTALLFILYTIIAINGFFKWKKLLRHA
jgi:nicotinamide mononucleotide transporter